MNILIAALFLAFYGYVFVFFIRFDVMMAFLATGFLALATSPFAGLLTNSVLTGVIIGSSGLLFLVISKILGYYEDSKTGHRTLKTHQRNRTRPTSPLDPPEAA